MRDSEETLKYAQMLDALVRKSGAKTVIFLTWAPRVAPIGVAWAELARSGIEVEEGGAHPTLAGSYLATCVLYATLYGRSPAGAMHTFERGGNDSAEGVGSGPKKMRAEPRGSALISTPTRSRE